MSEPSENSNSPHNRSPEALIERLFSQIGDVSSLPAVALEIMELADDPKTGAEDLLDAVRGDPALSMRLMRTVNSAYYGLQEKVADLKQAITLLGFTEVRNLAMTAYLARLFRDTESHGVYSRRELWNHMVGTAMVARLTAETCGHVKPQEAYLAGLLHDVGLILIDQYLHKPFCRVIDTLREDVPVCDAEMRILGFDHATLGAYVASQWNLPKNLVATIGYHHCPMQYEGEHRALVSVVSLANFFCHMKDLPSLGVRNVSMPPVELFVELGLQRPHITMIAEQLGDVLLTADRMALVQVA